MVEFFFRFFTGIDAEAGKKKGSKDKNRHRTAALERLSLPSCSGFQVSELGIDRFREQNHPTLPGGRLPDFFLGNCLSHSDHTVTSLCYLKNTSGNS